MKERGETEKELLTKAKHPLHLNAGIRPEQRKTEDLLRKGVVNIDKPKNPTSHQVSAWVRDMLGVLRAGHCGTLDPKVTGVLPVALDKATRLTGVVSGSGKEYVGIVHLHKEVPTKKVDNVLAEFTGKIYQYPPLKSAVKRRLRVREIYCLDRLEIEERNVLVRVGCQSGTYIRTLAVDIGDALGVGAHLKELRRTKAGPFDEEESYNLHALKDAWVRYEERGDEKPLREIVRPMEEMLASEKTVVIKDTAVDAVCHGANLGVNGIHKVETGISAGDRVALMTGKGEVVALGEATLPTRVILDSEDGTCAITNRVLMDPDTYPAVWK